MLAKGTYVSGVDSIDTLPLHMNDLKTRNN